MQNHEGANLKCFRLTFRPFTSLFWASNFARIWRLLSIAWYCFALTNMGSSAAGSIGNGTLEFAATLIWGWTCMITYKIPHRIFKCLCFAYKLQGKRLHILMDYVIKLANTLSNPIILLTNLSFTLKPEIQLAWTLPIFIWNPKAEQCWAIKIAKHMRNRQIMCAMQVYYVNKCIHWWRKLTIAFDVYPVKTPQ